MVSNLFGKFKHNIDAFLWFTKGFCFFISALHFLCLFNDGLFNFKRLPGWEKFGVLLQVMN